MAVEDDKRLIHIVGMYKCGTSWLSSIFAAHPSVIAWHEFDVIRTSMSETRISFINRAFSQLCSQFSLPYPAVSAIGLTPKVKERVIRDTFCGGGWVPLMGKELRDIAHHLDFSDSEKFIEALVSLADKNLANDARVPLRPSKFSHTLEYASSTKLELITFLDSIKQANDMSKVSNLFFSYLLRQCEPSAILVFKAADQMMCLQELDKVSPDSRKVVIIRDGRDAAISAFHFRKLMHKRQAPWAPRDRSYLQELRAWAVRARVLAKVASRSDVTVLRYEDLLADFTGKCGNLFRQLNIPLSLDELAKIKQITDFKVVTGGRKPGEAAEHIVRKGIAGEWKGALSQKEAMQAWRVAGRELERWGYLQDGTYVDFT